nr:unnamed protein product [Digitaria exilis]
MKDKAAAASVLQPQRAADKGRGADAVVVVAVRAAAREISKTAVVWALTHVVQHGDSILLLVVIPPPSSGRKFWGFPLFARDCASGHKAVLNQMSDVDELCSQMMLNLRGVYDPNKINVKVKILSGLPSGTVANESKRAQASWVVLDKELKHEEKHCLEELQCNIVVMKHARPKVLRLNLVGSPEKVGDFGLARWQPDGDMGVETRVIGTFGYLAPEYAQSGQITEKADVYSFGVVLVELVTGRKAVDINRPKGQQFLTEWARPLLEEYAIDELIDPRLGRRFCENEVYCMLHAANLCIRRNPHLRPRMSHVLRILEGGDMVVDSGSDAGSRSWRMLNENQRYQEQSSPAQHDSQRALETARSPWGQDRHNLSHRY